MGYTLITTHFRNIVIINRSIDRSIVNQKEETKRSARSRCADPPAAAEARPRGEIEEKRVGAKRVFGQAGIIRCLHEDRGFHPLIRPSVRSFIGPLFVRAPAWPSVCLSLACERSIGCDRVREYVRRSLRSSKVTILRSSGLALSRLQTGYGA